jgi:pimeloyl-ACP methyl ester carboxylesterase
MRALRLLPFLLVAFAATVHAQLPKSEPNLNPHLSHIPQRPLAHLAGPHAAPKLAGANVVSVVCPPGAQAFGAAMCGNVYVPLDREHRIPGTIPIYFELYAHSAPGPAQSAILVARGGPGLSTTHRRNFYAFLFGPNLDTHDLLLIDQRGRGLSGTIICPDLQFGNTTFVQGLEECAAQLGPAVSKYGSGDIADDMDAVRAALGYQKIDYYGASYGAADISAYATRFGEHLRSIVLDAPFGTPGAADSRFTFEQTRTQAEAPMVSLDCQRSPLCSADHPFPKAEFDLLVWAIRARPIEGDAYDANGNLTHVRLDENALLNFIVDNPTGGDFASTGEILAAARSLRAGDSLPLLRLGAEGFFPIDFANIGDPTVFSEGDSIANACADVSMPFDWRASIPERIEQYTDVVDELPLLYFAPFSAAAATGDYFAFFSWPCQYWQRPSPSAPIAEPNAKYPPVPTLLLTGDLDNRVPHDEVVEVAALFPQSALVSVESAGHVAANWTQCARTLASEFIESAQVPDTSCARTPESVYPAVGRFPLLARDARPAAVDPSGQNQIDLAERRVVSVAVAAAVDALQRSLIGFGTGVGLRGGTFQTNDYVYWTLSNCAFSQDITVSGTLVWATNNDNSVTADLTVSGQGTAGGTLHITGFWLVPGPVGNFKVGGTLGGKNVAALVPEA